MSKPVLVELPGAFGDDLGAHPIGAAEINLRPVAEIAVRLPSILYPAFRAPPPAVHTARRSVGARNRAGAFCD
jgi:hypothetical protein